MTCQVFSVGRHACLAVCLTCLWLCSLRCVCADDKLNNALAQRAVELLRTKCVSCHGPEQAEGDLRLDSAANLAKGGQRGPVVSNKSAIDSLLYQSVTGSGESQLQMPPKQPLSQTEIQLLLRWLESGAAWSSTAADTSPQPMHASAEPLGDAWSDPRNPILQIFRGERLGLWSLKPPIEPAVPEVHDASWCQHAIDRFVAARFESRGQALPRPADRHTLLRRVYFDLIGLPPPAEIASKFETSQDPLALEHLVDGLLASEQFGIHWARMWLDVARYSDSNGFDWDEFRPQAYRYRDYVIRSLNADKPFDRFVTEQLAGDELVAGAPRNPAEQDALIATGFLRMGPHDNAAKLFNEQDRSRDELLVDLVETTGGALLGMTLSCCRCHDHKHDPLSQADYFRFRANFAGVKFADDLPIDLADTQAEIEQHNAAIETRLTQLQDSVDQVLQAIRTRTAAPNVTSSQASAGAEPQELKPAELKKLANDAEKSQLDELEKTIAQAKSEKRSLTRAMLMIDEEKPAATYLLAQGDYRSPRNLVEPGIFSILNPNALLAGQTARPQTSGRRTALAHWITSRSNPLTARVIVNRVWLNLMGQGLVRTPGDFGMSGLPPEQPELLDWLSVRFMEEGWSLKRLIRTIMLTKTYQQTPSFQQPEEGLVFATRRPRRLTAEQLRDSMLAVSGLLTSQVDGPPKWPDLPREVLDANPAFLDDNETRTKGWYPSPAAEQYCRSIFLVQKRNTRVPLLETLDQPENSVPCQCRAASIVAPQALSLLNGSVAVAASKGLAERILSLAKNPPAADSVNQNTTNQNTTAQVSAADETAARITVAFWLALQREPSQSERTAIEGLLQYATWDDAARVLLNINEFAYVD